MHLKPILFVVSAWGVFLCYWLYAARSVKRPRVRQAASQRILAYSGMIVCAVLLAFQPGKGPPVLNLRAWPASPAARWTGVVLCVAGIAFAIWARRVLADNWSAEVQIKENHALITSGPYGIVRHPIYTGICAALVGTWMTVGSLGGLLGIGIGLFGLWRKLMLEEQFMRTQFPDMYPDYAARVKRLVPGVF